MRRNRWGTILLVLLLSLGVASCGGSDAELEGQTWTLEGVGGRVAVSSAISTATFTGGTLNGNSGCNEFSGTYSVTGDAMTIELGPATLRACEGNVGEQESALFEAFMTTTTFSIDGTDLRLLDEADTVLARYTSDAG
ncbi:MAG TPA: META domain-containing protein [Acidimicrobiia bacterium]|nr:META domain-containing protein [Acidimicrobiia bacterium]